MRLKILVCALMAAVALPCAAFAEKTEIKISKQYGLPYLPLMVAEEHKLIEKQAEAAGIKGLKVSWLTLGSGAATNDAFLSGNVDIISGGIGPFLRLWDKSHGRVKALAGLDRSPQVLNSSRAEVQSLGDFTQKDRIAVPAVKVSMQALALQMAVAKEYGIKNYDKLDYLTVSAKYPDAAIALMSGAAEITAHVTSEPFRSLELQSPNVHSIFNSYDVLGGPHISNLVSTSESFYSKNPQLARAVLKALDEACQWIAANKKEAAALYLKASNSKENPQFIEGILEDPQIIYAVVPSRITLFSDFLRETGSVKRKADSWKDLFFDAIHDRDGS